MSSALYIQYNSFCTDKVEMTFIQIHWLNEPWFWWPYAFLVFWFNCVTFIGGFKAVKHSLKAFSYFLLLFFSFFFFFPFLFSLWKKTMTMSRTNTWVMDFFFAITIFITKQPWRPFNSLDCLKRLCENMTSQMWR